MNTTIAAISTPPGRGGIAIIRISGENALAVADAVFSGGVKLSRAGSHTVHYGFIKHNGETIDEVLATVMRAPKTFTREDVVEISAHGGTAAARKVLEACLAAGAEPAEPGEFTKRAFLNGRIDLSQAEAVIDVINAENNLSRKNAVSQLQGSLSREIREIRGELVHLAAAMQVIIDYPDEDLADVTEEDILDTLTACKAKADRLLSTADSGAVLRDGIRAAIAGKPNVGKSSLLNALARYDRAIVTDVAGTTRDTIEERVDLDGVPLVLIDTAGIRDTSDAVEKIGVERSRRSVAEADLVIVVIDGSTGLDGGDRDILESTADLNRIILLNKTDLGSGVSAREVKEKAGMCPIIEVSALTGAGIDELRAAVSDMYKLGAIESGTGAVITNARHKSALIKAASALESGINALHSAMPTDIVSIDIGEAITALGEITGETVSDAVVKDIFHSFCVGK